MPSAADFILPKSREKIYAWIIELSSPETREAALLELSKKREVAVKTEIHVKNLIIFEIIQGVSKKRYFSVFCLFSVLVVGLYFFTLVLESEFLARFISPLKQYPFRILTALKD